MTSCGPLTSQHLLCLEKRDLLCEKLNNSVNTTTEGKRFCPQGAHRDPVPSDGGAHLEREAETMQAGGLTNRDMSALDSGALA